MIGISKKLALLCLFLALPSLALAQPEAKKAEPDIKTVLDKLDKMHTGIGMMDVNIGKAFGTLSSQIVTQINKMQDDITEANKRADCLEKQVKALREELNSLKKNNGSIDLAAKREAKSVPLPAPTGRILLANHYTDEMTFYVNDKRWVVPAQSTVLVENMPVGTFSYKVTHAIYGERSNNPAATLNAGQTYTLSVK